MAYPPRPCPVCKSQQKERLYQQKFAKLTGQIQLDGYYVVVCRDCGAAFADSIPDQAWFNSYYSEISKYTYDQRAGEVSPFDAARFRDIGDLIAKHLHDKNCRIFDFGCATGGLLMRLKHLGYFNVYGMEMSPASAEIAREQGIPVVNSSLEEIAKTQEPFDILIQVGVLEHLCELENLLAAMRGVLKPGALMYIEVPDVVGFDEWPGAPFQQFSIEHINFFSSASLISLMFSNGFEPVDVLRTARDQSVNTKMPVVCGFFRMLENAVPEIKRDDESGPALRGYIDHCIQMERDVCRTIDELVEKQTPIIVWGVGTHTLHLIETTSFLKMNIAAFVDSNTHYQDRKIHGRQVLAPPLLKERTEPIFISSQLFQTEISDQIRQDLKLTNPLITLYKA